MDELPVKALGKMRYEVRDGHVYMVMDVLVEGYPQMEATLEVPDELAAAWLSTERYSIDVGDDS